MIKLRRLSSNQKGAAVIELAFAFPVLIIMTWAVVQLGLAFRAMSGIQHSLGEGARYATLFPQPTPAAIKTKMSTVVYGIKPGTFTIPNPVVQTDSATGAKYIDLQVQYTQPTDLLLLPGPTINVTRTKRVWVAT